MNINVYSLTNNKTRYRNIKHFEVIILSFYYKWKIIFNTNYECWNNIFFLDTLITFCKNSKDYLVQYEKIFGKFQLLIKFISFNLTTKFLNQIFLVNIYKHLFCKLLSIIIYNYNCITLTYPTKCYLFLLKNVCLFRNN